MSRHSLRDVWLDSRVMDSSWPCVLSLTGDSLIRKAVSDTIRGKMAVMANTPLVPHVSMSEPLKYALTIPPTADEPQQRDCSDPAIACRAVSLLIAGRKSGV